MVIFSADHLNTTFQVYYEIIKAFIEKGFGACNFERAYHADQDNFEIFDLPNNLRKLSSMLDDMTNSGLQRFAEILTGGSIQFEKTRWKMKKIIRDCLPEIVGNWKGNCETNIAEQLSQILKNSHKFHRNLANLLTTPPPSYRAAAIKVLDGLGDMPFVGLSAMHRKLTGIRGYVPQLYPLKSGWGRSILSDRVRKICTEMLSELSEEDELQEPLAKAMAVRSLSSSLIQGCPFVPQFWRFSPEIVALQNEIAKAIWLLKEVRFPELKILQLLLDPNAELSNRSLRNAVRNLLTEYLFECGDMDSIPDYLLEAVNIINRTSQSAPYRFFSEGNIAQEVECVLCASAQIKQILWDLLPEYEFDNDFADAYIENLEESCSDAYDEDSINDAKEQLFSQNSLFHPNDPDNNIEFVGETNLANLMSPGSTSGRNETSSGHGSKIRLRTDSFERVETVHSAKLDLLDTDASASSLHFKFNNLDNMEANQIDIGSARRPEMCDSHLLTLRTNGIGCASHLSPDARLDGNHTDRQENKVDSEKLQIPVCEGSFLHDNTGANKYLALQEACDMTSLVSYHLIGHVLDEFANMGGLDLDWTDVLYLRGDNSIRKDSEGT